MTSGSNLEGLRGWLILVVLGVVVSPLRIVFMIITTYPEIFATGTWEVLTDPVSESYIPYWGPVLILELLTNFCLIITWLFVAYLLFTKKRLFPRFYIGLVVFSLIFILADSFVINLILPEIEIFDYETIRELVQSFTTVLIWVPYMLLSKRVKATFVN